MKKYPGVIGMALVVTMFLAQCSNDGVSNTVKLLPNDPFKNTIVSSQFFSINSEQDNVIAGEHGTVIVCPKGCFKDATGKMVEGDVKIELAESLTMDDMTLSNLTTTSNGKPLETDGMIYFNAMKDGKQLQINKDIPVHIEIPTRERKPGMMAYKGIRDENGNMNWIDPKKLDNFLKTVDIVSLDFLPPGFQGEVDNGMPFRKYSVATQALTDSLYYALSFENLTIYGSEKLPTQYNEPYYNQAKKVKKGKYTNESYQTEFDTVFDDSVSRKETCGIDPAIIKVIKSDKYQQTLIATREFEARLKIIFETCDNAVLEIYIRNLDKNLYELDSMAAKLCEEKKYFNSSHAFYDLSLQRLMNVKDAGKYAALLKDYYSQQLLRVKTDLNREKDKVVKALQKKDRETQKIVDDYRKLLWKREKYRMETYGFDWTETGWVNIDNGTLPKDWSEQPLEIDVTNGKQFDRVYTYVIYSTIKSLCRLNTDDGEHFYVGNITDKSMLMPDRENAIAVSIGYKGDKPSLAIKVFETNTQRQLTLTLSSSSAAQVKEMLGRYEERARENSISQDLAFMDKLYKGEKQQKDRMKENEFMLRLLKVAYPCCDREQTEE
jgi:hypothetical protein